MTSIQAQIVYAAAWLLFGLSHSVTAGATAETGLGRLFGRAHRLAFNVLAIAEFGIVLAIGAWAGRGATDFVRPEIVMIMQIAMVIAGVLLGVVALRSYRAGPFMGWSQFRGEDDDAQPLVIHGLNKRMRHPLYSAALLLLWGLVRDDIGLATAVWGSLYLYIGSRFEERKLVARYGEAYRHYRATTPRFYPRMK